MTQDDELPLYNLSRRRVLAGLGAVGIASAGTGLGTSAFFSDEEEFTDNRLQAGTLDLKLDYKATYFGGPGRLDAVARSARTAAGSDADRPRADTAVRDHRAFPSVTA